MVVVVKVTKEHGNGDLVKGFENIKKHIDNLKNVFGLNVVVAINKHSDDSDEDILTLKELCEKENAITCIANPYGLGGKGCIELASQVVKLSNSQNNFNYVYELTDTVQEKIAKIATKVYGAKSVNYSDLAKEKLKLINKFDMDNFFVNIAKTQFSFSDDKNLLGAPKDFEFNVTDIEIRSGAKMLVVIAGNMLLMPGLGKSSNYLNMTIDDKGIIEGLF